MGKRASGACDASEARAADRKHKPFCLGPAPPARALEGVLETLRLLSLRTDGDQPLALF
jgi:hypothetical protein